MGIVDGYTLIVYLLMAIYCIKYLLLDGSFLETKITLSLFVVVLFLGSTFVSNILSPYVDGEGIVNSVRLTLLVMFSFSVVKTFSFDSLLKTLLAAEIICLVFCLLSLILPGHGFEDYGFGMSFVGIWTTKNVCAGVIGFICLTLYVAYRVQPVSDNARDIKLRKIVLIPSFVVCVVLLLLSDALGAALCVLVPIVATVISSKTGIRVKRLGTVWAMASVAFLLFATSVLPLFSDLLSAFGKTADLTGRTDIWVSIIQLVCDNRPYFGFGYGDFWSEQNVVYPMIRAAYQANGMLAVHIGSHNAIVELFLMFGAFGVAAYLVMIAYSLDRIEIIKDSRVIFAAHIFVTYFMLYCLTERSLSYLGYQSFFLFLFIAVATKDCRDARLVKK